MREDKWEQISTKKSKEIFFFFRKTRECRRLKQINNKMSLSSPSWSYGLLVYKDMKRAQTRLPGMRRARDKGIFTARTMKSFKKLI